MARLIREAHGDVIRCRVLFGISYVTCLVFGVLGGLAVHRALVRALGSSSGSHLLLSRADPLVLYELFNSNDQLFSRAAWVIAGVLAAGTLVRLLITGAVLDLLAGQHRFRWRACLAGSVRLFRGLLFLAAIESMLLAGLVFLHLLDLPSLLLGEPETESTLFVADIAWTLVLAAVATAIIQGFKYAKIYLARDHRPERAIIAGMRFFLTNTCPAIAISLSALIITGGGVAIKWLFAGMSSGGSSQIVLAIAATQLAVLAHQYGRFLSLAASMRLASEIRDASV
ncbi:MAG: hypothetical protein HYX75_02770 [Acidobacteria bacterium]|nr:hypothetical protein [Acidobacteriota bacterium]